MGNKLNKATYENTPIWSLDGKVINVKILKVYDGDTFWVALKLNGKVVRHKVRLYGVDTPELKPSLSLKNRDKEIKAAKKAKNFVEELINNKVVEMLCGKWDKYGRLLGTIYIYEYGCLPCWYKKFSLGDMLIENRLGKPYYGGTK
jgi:endonuclease YncB( thermonuclease family)